MSTAMVFLDIEKSFDTTLQPGLLYKLHKLNFSENLIKLISSFLSMRKLTIFSKGKMFTPTEILAGVPQGSVLSSELYSMYINDMSKMPGVYLFLFAEDTCMYTTDSKRSYCLRKLQQSQFN
jgi:hypothetical protein